MIRSATLVLPVPRRADSPRAFVALFGRRRLRGAISPSAVNVLASAIQTQEGYYPGSLAYQNNNPGNLVYAGQPGASPGAGGFADFSSYDAGLSALKNQITLDATRGTDVNGNPINTVSDLITSWAPPSQNNTAAYIASVSAQTGYDPDAPLSTLGASAVPAAPVILATDSTGSTGSDGFTLPDFSEGSTLDLSSVGLSSAVPWWWIVAGAAGVLLLAR